MKKPAKEKPVAGGFETLLEGNKSYFFIGALVLFTLMSLLLFNMRVSIGGDDSTYIIRAVNFLNEGAYPSFQGPVYPLFLSLFIALGGIHLGLLKLTSLACMLLGLVWFYKAFNKRIPASVLFATLFLMGASSYVVFFSSQTYSEALFFCLQVPIFILLFKDIDHDKTLSYPRLVGIAGLIVLGYLTRTVGIGALVAVLAFYVLLKAYKKAGIVLGASLLLLVLALATKTAIWQTDFFDGGQASTLLYKHPYDMDQGKETLTGFIGRFADNSKLYLSKHTLKMIGLKSEASKSTNGGITLLFYLLFIWAASKAFKNNKYVLFTAIYVAAMLGITFIVLQKLWDQYRLIVPFFPFMLVVLFYGLYMLKKQFNNTLANWSYNGLIMVCLGASLAISFSNVDLMTLRKNMKGDRLLGYTDDWVHYFSMVEYVREKLPDEAYVAVRKPNMARIYADGKKFYGIYRFDTDNPDELLQALKDKGVTHLIMASLRKNPEVYTGETINTIQRYMALIARKYPAVFTLEHKIGEVEPAYLFKINYDRTFTQEELNAMQTNATKQ